MILTNQDWLLIIQHIAVIAVIVATAIINRKR